MKPAKSLLVFLLLAAFLLPGCGKKELDADTLALAEACDAVCHVRPLAERYQPNAQFPDEPYKRLMECLVTADYRGNLSEEGTDLSHASSRYIYVLVDKAWLEGFLEDPTGLTLFLDRSDKAYHDHAVFVPHGENGLQVDEPGQAGLQREKLLRAWGKSHPAAPLENATFPVTWGNLAFDFRAPDPLF